MYEESIYEQYLCNMCGEDLQTNQFGYLEEHVNIKKRWGYGSKLDNQVHNICLCTGCYEGIFNKLKIKPTVLNLL